MTLPEPTTNSEEISTKLVDTLPEDVPDQVTWNKVLDVIHPIVKEFNPNGGTPNELTIAVCNLFTAATAECYQEGVKAGLKNALDEWRNEYMLGNAKGFEDFVDKRIRKLRGDQLLNPQGEEK